MNERWAFDELRRRQFEDSRFPADMAPGMPGWMEYAEMKRQRAARRKIVGLSRGQAHEWVDWAREMEAKR